MGYVTPTSRSEVSALPVPHAFSLVASPQAASAARREVRRLEDDLPSWVLEDAAVIVSELVTNAVRYGDGRVEVQVWPGPRVLRIEVADGSHQLPQLVTPGPDAEGGRGLQVVGALATRWGVLVDGHKRGKVVWCELDVVDRGERDDDESLRNLGRVLEGAEAASPVDAVGAVTRELGVALGAISVSFLIVDLSGRGLVRLTHVPLGATANDGTGPSPSRGARRSAEEWATAVPFDGGPAEEAVRTQTVQVVAEETVADGAARRSWRLLAPVTERGESVGLLELCLPTRPTDDDVGEVARLAHLLAFVVIANRRHTDFFEWGQRSTSFSLSAEIQQRLLPSARTCEAGAFSLSGWLEPAADIAGDTFDYSLGRDELFLSMTDAMGHGVSAALTATLCVASLRNQRRSGGSVVEQAMATNAAVAEHGALLGVDDFVTGLVGRLDLRSASLQLVNAGHVPPYLCRGRDVRTLDLAADVPFGLFARTAYTSHTLRLQPGDRLVFLTDGMVERNAAHIDMPAVIAQTRGLHVREAVRALADRVLEVSGQQLRDDATAVCLDWHGGHGADRHVVNGADRERASAAMS